MGPRYFVVTLALCALAVLGGVQARSSPDSADWHRSLYRGVERSVGVDEATQIRLSFVPEGMAVSWATVAAQASMPSVSYGVSAGALSSTAQANESSTYGTLTFYTAIMQQLQSNQRYYYNVEGSSEVYSFVAAKAPGDQQPFTVLVVGQSTANRSRDRKC